MVLRNLYVADYKISKDFISFIYFHIELNNRYNQIRKLVKMGYKGHYNAYMKPKMVQYQFDNTVGWLLYM